MKKTQAAVLTAALLFSAAGVSANMEDVQVDSARALSEGLDQAAKLLKDRKAARQELGEAPETDGEGEPYPMPEPRREPVLQWPELTEGIQGQSAGALLGTFTLAERLDTHSDLFTLPLGAGTYDISLASDPKFAVQYLAFRQPGRLLLHRIKNINDLRGKGVDVKLDDKTAYNFKVKANIFNPTRGSTLKIDPINGTQGPSHSIKTGKILDAVERESFIFKTDGKTFWLLYGTDVDPATNELAGTRSLLIIHEDGLSSKAWPIAEGRLEAGKPLEAGLGDTKIVLVKSLAGRLSIHAPAKSAAPAAR